MAEALVQLSIRVPEWVYSELRALADERRRSVTGEAVWAIMEQVRPSMVARQRWRERLELEREELEREEGSSNAAASNEGRSEPGLSED